MARLVGNLRYFVIVAVIGIAARAVATFGRATLITVDFIDDLVRTSAWQGDDTVIALLQVLDLYLVGTVLIITSIGLYELFIGEVQLPEWLVIRTLSDLKAKIVEVIVLVIEIEFLEGLAQGRVAIDIFWLSTGPPWQRRGSPPSRNPIEIIHDSLAARIPTGTRYRRFSAWVTNLEMSARERARRATEPMRSRSGPGVVDPTHSAHAAVSLLARRAFRVRVVERVGDSGFGVADSPKSVSAHIQRCRIVQRGGEGGDGRVGQRGRQGGDGSKGSRRWTPVGDEQFDETSQVVGRVPAALQTCGMTGPALADTHQFVAVEEHLARAEAVKAHQ